MTRVAAVGSTIDIDGLGTYAEMFKTVTRRRRVDKAKVHRALALLARDLDLFVANFNSRLKTIAQLTFHDAPDDLRVASIARSQGKKRSRRAGARVQRGRRNEAKRARGVEASPNPLFRATNEEDTAKSPEGRWREPPRKVSAVAPFYDQEQQPRKMQKKKGESTGRFAQKEEKRPPLVVQGGAVESAPMGLPILVVQEGAVGTSPSEAPALTSDSRAVGAVTVGTAVLWKKEEAVAFVPAQEEATKRKAAPLQQEEQTPPFSEDSTATFLQAFKEKTRQIAHQMEQAGQQQFQQQFQQQIQQQYQQPFQQQYQQPFQQQPQQPFQQPYQQQFQQQFQQPFQPFQQQQFGGQFQQ